MRPHKMLLNQYPAQGEAVTTFEFVTNPSCGVPRIIDFFNGWAKALPELKDILIIRYEDMRVDPVGVMQRVLDFVGTPGTRAVSYTHLTLPTNVQQCRSRWSPYH